MIHLCETENNLADADVSIRHSLVWNSRILLYEFSHSNYLMKYQSSESEPLPSRQSHSQLSNFNLPEIFEASRKVGDVIVDQAAAVEGSVF